MVLASQLLSDVAFALEIGDEKIISTIVLCALLGAFYAALSIAVAGSLGRPGLVLSIGLGLALIGYLVAALLPLSDVLAPWRQVSPWEWALGGDPLVNAAEPWRYVALTSPAVILTVVGIAAFARRGPCGYPEARHARLRSYFAGRKATWIWIATPGGGSKPRTSLVL